jgi:hypothetical protein
LSRRHVACTRQPTCWGWKLSMTGRQYYDGGVARTGQRLTLPVGIFKKSE